MRLRSILISVAAACTVSLGATTAAMAAPATVSSAAGTAKPFSCPGNTVCLFSGDNFNGGVTPITPPNFGHWRTAVVTNPSGDKEHPGSAHNNTKGIVWFYSITTKARECVNAGKKPVLNHTYGWVFVQITATHCRGNKLPQPVPT
jgi:Peptidase inhibitor family I36